MSFMIFTVTDGFAARPPRPAAARDPDRSLRDIRVEHPVTFHVTCSFYYISSESPGTVAGRARRTFNPYPGSPERTGFLCGLRGLCVPGRRQLLGHQACAGRVKMV